MKYKRGSSMNVPLIDLQAQYRGIAAEINEAVISVLESGRYILSDNVEALEKELAAYCGVPYAVGVASGTDALLLCLEAYGIGFGDEVVTTPYTFFASAEAISRVGAVPVFADIDPVTFNIDPRQIEKKINAKTKAVIPVHLFGQVADMEAIMDLSEKYGLLVIEDACQAIGAGRRGKKAGSFGHAACFSFFPTKNLGGYGDGGMVVTADKKVAAKIRILRAHGSAVKYYHQSHGYNSRLDEIQAAVLRVKLKQLDRWNALRREKAGLYSNLLNGTDIIPPFSMDEDRHIYHLYVVRSKRRGELMAKLRENGVATAVYYPVPLHLQEVYRSLDYRAGDLPEAERAAGETFAIPLYPELVEDVQREIVRILLS